jgi:FkbM family methyltransferase
MRSNLIHQLIGSLGYRLYKKAFMPKGCDFCLDIKRLYRRNIYVAFDVGANIGQTAKLIRLEFPKASIHCFEPRSDLYSLLSQTLAQDRNISFYPFALGEKAGRSKLSITEDTVSNSLLHYDADNSLALSFEEVEVRTIDEFMAEQKIECIDLLKTDTEGYDLEVLKGSQKALERGKIRFIFTEATIRDDDLQRTNFFSLYHYLEQHSMHLYALYDLYHLENPVRINYFNALFFRSN